MQEGPGFIAALVYLPKFYNPDAHGIREMVEAEKLEQTAREITEHFEEGGTIFDSGDPPTGFWWDKGFVDRDVLVILEVDIPDTPQSRAWLKSYAREVLLERFRQRAIDIKYVAIERALVTAEVEKVSSEEGE